MDLRPNCKREFKVNPKHVFRPKPQVYEPVANHTHPAKYLELSKSTGEETITDAFTYAANGIEGNIYLGPEQYVSSFTDDGGGTWFIYNFFKAYQKSEQERNDGFWISLGHAK